jgi:hypothetical protein
VAYSFQVLALEEKNEKHYRLDTVDQAQSHGSSWPVFFFFFMATAPYNAQ